MKAINYTIICIILSIMIWLVIEEYKDNQIEKEKTMEAEYSTENISMIHNIEKRIKENNTNKEYPKEQIIDEYKGYKVIAKLEIPTIKLETYILKQYSVDALNISVVKFWGADPNKVGNFCIAGHNFQNKNMFRNLKKLDIGNRFTISDNTIGKIEYEIYSIYKVDPKDVSCLSQQTAGKREVTLITCTSDSEKRIIVKAKEVEE